MSFYPSDSSRLYLTARMLCLASIALTICLLSSVNAGAKEQDREALIGVWRFSSPNGNTYVRFRKDHWYVGLHFFDEQQHDYGVWSVGHWGINDKSLILQRVAGGQELDKVAAKRAIAISDVKDDRFVLGTVPFDGQVFKRVKVIPPNVGRHLTSSVRAQGVYAQTNIIFPEDPPLDVETHVTIDGGHSLFHLYLLPAGELLATVRNGDDLTGKWERTGDILVLSGVSKLTNANITIKLKRINGQYRVVFFTRNGTPVPQALTLPPFVESKRVDVLQDGSLPELTAGFYLKLNSFIGGRSKSEVLKTLYKEEEKQKEAYHYDFATKSDAHSGAFTGYARQLDESGKLETLMRTTGHYNALLGTLMTTYLVAGDENQAYRIGVITRQDPLTTEWFYPAGTHKEQDLYIMDSVMENDRESTSRKVHKKNGKLCCVYAIKTTKIIDGQSLEITWNAYKTEFARINEDEVELRPLPF